MKKFIDCAFKIIFSRTLIIIVMILLQIMVLLAGFTWLGRSMSFIWEIMNVLGALLVIHIINKDEPTEFKMSWIIIICLLPVLGALIYLLVVGNFGGLGLKKRLQECARETEGLVETSKETGLAITQSSKQFQGFAHYMEQTAGFPVYHNSKAVYFPSGEEKFRDLLEELKKAEKFIFLEYFIVEPGIMWNAILDILKEKVKEGVEVRVMYDGMCSILLLPYGYPEELKGYGIKAKMFSPIRPFLSTSQNNRDHRKILVIDGKVAYTGGVNFADEYINEKERFGHWKDVAVRVNGRAVKSFTVMFLQMWNVYEKEQEDYSRYLDGIDYSQVPRGDGFMIPYGDTPTRHAEVAKTVYVSIISSATSYVHIMTPYFIVDREFFDNMRYAAQKGVEVSMILPHIPDKKAVYYIARTFYPQLLEAGIKVYEYTPGFVHAKSVMADREAALIGSTNMDYRSFQLHYEDAVMLYHMPVIEDLLEDMDRIMADSCPYTLADWEKRSWLRRTAASILKLGAIWL